MGAVQHPRGGRRLQAIVLALTLLAAQPASSERPMTVDDAGTLAAGGGKLELGWSRDDDLRGLELAAGYAPLENLELELAYARGHNPARDPWRNQWSRGLAVKWVPLQPETGLALGIRYEIVREAFEPDDGPRRWGRSQGLTGLASWRWASGAALHLNLGREWGRFDGDDEAVTTWGVGAEHALSDRLSLTVETYGDSGSRPDRAAGVRYEVADGVKLSAAVGRGNDRSFFNAGLTWEF